MSFAVVSREHGLDVDLLLEVLDRNLVVEVVGAEDILEFLGVESGDLDVGGAAENELVSALGRPKVEVHHAVESLERGDLANAQVVKGDNLKIELYKLLSFFTLSSSYRRLAKAEAIKQAASFILVNSRERNNFNCFSFPALYFDQVGFSQKSLRRPIRANAIACLENICFGEKIHIGKKLVFILKKKVASSTWY